MNRPFPRLRAINAVVDERNRQVDQEGYTAEHDDTHDRGELAQAAAAYAVIAWYLAMGGDAADLPASIWPEGWGPMPVVTDPRKALTRAGALILAELERLDRAETAVSP